MSIARLGALIAESKDLQDLASKIQIRSAYDGTSEDGTPLVCPEETLAVQSAKDDCDINVILKRYQNSMEAVFPYAKPGWYGDVTDAPTFIERMDQVVQAQQWFDALPPRLRNRFDNNPAKLFEFLADEENIDEAIALKLLAPLEEPEAPPATPPATPPAPPAPPTGSGTPPGA